MEDIAGNSHRSQDKSAQKTPRKKLTQSEAIQMCQQTINPFKYYTFIDFDTALRRQQRVYEKKMMNTIKKEQASVQEESTIDPVQETIQSRH